MFPILAARDLAPRIRRFEVAARRIARRQRPGQFVIVRLHERGERIPLTIAAADPDAGSITLVVQAVGKTTLEMNALGAGGAILDVVGPLARAEGIRFQTLTHPVEFLGSADGALAGIRCIRMELGEPDDSGRRRPVPVAGSEHEIPAEVAIIAVGTTANPIVQSATPGLATDRRGYIQADPETLRTSKPGVFAGGDIVTGAATVILAMGAGRRAAAAIDAYLASGAWEAPPLP